MVSSATRPSPSSPQAQFFSYAEAANPIRNGLTAAIPYRSFSPAFFQDAGNAIQPLDLSQELGCEGPATGPSLCANFVRLDHADLRTSATATSQLFFVAEGEGETEACGARFRWSKGDMLVLPAGGDAVHASDGRAGLYWVHDAPLLRHLGVIPSEARFTPTFYSHHDSQRHLAEIAASPSGAKANRVSILMGNSAFPQSRTVSHTLWAMLGILPAGQMQKPHRHQSIALDFAVACQPGCYTLIGTELNPDGTIRNPHREDWVEGAAFVTPPGYWHSHRMRACTPTCAPSTSPSAPDSAPQALQTGRLPGAAAVVAANQVLQLVGARFPPGLHQEGLAMAHLLRHAKSTGVGQPADASKISRFDRGRDGLNTGLGPVRADCQGGLLISHRAGSELADQHRTIKAAGLAVENHQSMAPVAGDEAEFATEGRSRRQLLGAFAERAGREEHHLLAKGAVVLLHGAAGSATLSRRA